MENDSLFSTVDKKTSYENVVLFACIHCNGPLVPHSYCIVCHRTISRQCVRCKTVLPYWEHPACRAIIEYVKTHAEQKV